MINEENTRASSDNPAASRSGFKLMPKGHRGRLAQIPIYLGKDFRMFIFQNDWKVLPMSALIAALIGGPSSRESTDPACTLLPM